MVALREGQIGREKYEVKSTTCLEWNTLTQIAQIGTDTQRSQIGCKRLPIMRVGQHTAAMLKCGRSMNVAHGRFALNGIGFILCSRIQYLVRYGGCLL